MCPDLNKYFITTTRKFKIWNKKIHLKSKENRSQTYFGIGSETEKKISKVAVVYLWNGKKKKLLLNSKVDNFYVKNGNPLQKKKKKKMMSEFETDFKKRFIGLWYEMKWLSQNLSSRWNWRHKIFSDQKRILCPILSKNIIFLFFILIIEIKKNNYLIRRFF